MRIYPEQLLQHIKQQVPGCCLIFGDEALLCLEASDQILHTAKSQGYLEKFSFSLDGNFEKDQIFNEFNSFSLFSDKKIIELSFSKSNKDNTAFIREISQLLHPDILLILQGPKLNNQQMNSVWFKTLEQQGIFVAANQPAAHRFPQWIFQRLKALHLRADKDVVDYLCVHFEGNLLAAKQEFEKLALLYPKQHLTLQQVEQSITTHNHFSLFQWVDSLLDGDKARASRILSQLKAEGTELLLLTATLSSEIQKLLKLSYQSSRTPLPQLLSQQQPKLWPAKQKLVSDALQRLKTPQLESLTIQCAEIEVAVKVENNTDNWLKLDALSGAFFN
ncbi:DNA polymerase III subunit delta [Psychromonas aquimarina]|uniref:DNA polymerase III subunit delta n=1 Tax=Psychromonas aquimarina TaxID=444919 RepID=UPI0003FACFAF|nr:DNA polymerase III subunit delta [Psychromonas aquimarina]